MTAPFLTTAERCVAGVLDPVAPIVGPALDASKPHPHHIAYRGYVPAPGWPRAYYLEAGGWIDTETGEVWACPTAG
jgi:hypothetical protein